MARMRLRRIARRLVDRRAVERMTARTIALRLEPGPGARREGRPVSTEEWAALWRKIRSCKGDSTCE